MIAPCVMMARNLWSTWENAHGPGAGAIIAVLRGLRAEKESVMTTATTVTLDRDLVEHFIVEVDALGRFESIRSGGCDTLLVEHVYRIIDEFEKAALGPMTDEESDALHQRGNKRGRELAREIMFVGGESDAS